MFFRRGVPLQNRIEVTIHMQPVFLIGSPRSGTTLLGEILGLHPDIAYWYEPTFVHDRYFRDAPHDRRSAADASPPVCATIQREFAHFSRRFDGRLIVDKSPRHSLKVPFLHAIFPDARYLHLIRHGGDATLSIYREWQSRQTAGRRLLSRRAFDRLRTHIAYQPLLRHRIAALCFQLGANPLALRTHTYRTRWDGRLGWGPRFEGWQDVIDQVSPIEFNALQWARCVDTALDDRPLIAADHWIDVYYEELITRPADVLHHIAAFMGLTLPPGYLEHLPPIRSANSGKWRAALSPADQERVAHIIMPTLARVGYALDDEAHA
jgi:hypothetical protein